MTFETSQHETEVFTVGAIDICVVRDPLNYEGELGEHEQCFDFRFTGYEWDALFFNVLHCPSADPYIEGENLNEYEERYRIKFQQAIPDYPMLGRIYDLYQDIRYMPEEVQHLRGECLRVKASTDNAHALEGLNKLIQACDEALKLGMGLYLVSD